MKSMIQVKIEDILSATEEYIVHQCNCITTHAKGLAQAISVKFPHADPYTHRVTHDTPGTIRIFPDPSIKDDPYKRPIIAMYAQFAPGKPGVNDSVHDRVSWFWKCLIQIAELQPKSVAFPWSIGCGLAGGDWFGIYYPMLIGWAKQHPEISVVLYKVS